MWKSDIEIFALVLLPHLPPLLPKRPASLTPLLPALLFSLIEFNSAQGDSVIDRLRETEEIWFKLFFTVHILCQIFLFLFFTVPWALQLIACLHSFFPLFPSTPSHPTEPWPATAAWPDVKEKEREEKERWRTGWDHLLQGTRPEMKRERWRKKTWNYSVLNIEDATE